MIVRMWKLVILLTNKFVGIIANIILIVEFHDFSQLNMEFWQMFVYEPNPILKRLRYAWHYNPVLINNRSCV